MKSHVAIFAIAAALALPAVALGAFKSSTGLRNGLLTTLNTTFSSKTLEIRAGTQPTHADDSIATGTICATITLPATPFSVSGASLAKTGTWQDASADNACTATWFVMYDTADGTGSTTTAERIVGSVTATGGGGDLVLDNTSIAAGQTVTISTFAITQAE
jgi:hypothetical protein